MPCLTQAVSCVWYCEYGGDNHPLIRNFLNGMGFMSFMGGALEVALGNVNLLEFPEALKWLGFIGLVVATTVHAQDFRDREGDRVIRRRTIQAMFGDANTRWSVVVGIAVACWMGSAFWELGWKVVLWTGSVGGIIVE